MTEDTVDLSKKTLDGGSIETPQHNKGLINQPTTGEPLENYDERLAGDVLESMHDVAALSAGNAKGDGKDVKVSGLQEQHFDNGNLDLNYFTIEYGDKGFAIFSIKNEIFYRPLKEFEFIFKEVLGGDDSIYNATMFTRDIKNPEETLVSTNVKRREDCLFIVDSIFGSLTGQSYNRLPVSVNDNVNENCKIRRNNKLGTDGDIKKSIAAHDAKYQSKEDKDFDAEVEREQKTKEVVGCLDQQQTEESVKIRKNATAVNETPEEFKLVLPNQARYTKVEESIDIDKARFARGPKTRISVSPVDGGKYENAWIFEPSDQVIFQIMSQYGPDPKKDVEWLEYRGTVTDVVDDIEESQLVTILCAGHTIIIPARDIRPDMSKHMRNRFEDCPDEPRLGSREGMGINPETRLTDKVENDPTDYRKEYNDFNSERFFMSGFLMKDDQIVSFPLRISVKDVSESKQFVRAMNEDGQLIEIPAKDIAVDTENWPWAVIVMDDSDSVDADEPLRKIRVNPTSYIDADEESDGAEGLVDIILNGVETKMMKKHIKLIV